MSSVWLLCAAVVGGVWMHLWRKYGYSGSTLMVLMFVLMGGFASGYPLLGVVDGIFELFWSWYGVGIVAFVFIAETVSWLLNEKPVRPVHYRRDPFVPGHSRPTPEYKSDHLLFLLWRLVGGRSPVKRSPPSPPPRPQPKREPQPILPPDLRTQHTHVVAGTGAGKTTLFHNLILEDLETDCSIVLVDSQGDLIDQLATRISPDRLILIDPEHCPPAIDLFNGDQDIASAVELYEYIFSALDARMTSKQALCYRFVSRLLMNVPNANIHTFREVLEPGTTHQEHVTGLGETVESFFRNEYNSRQFAETRAEILRRLYTVLENDTFARMFSARESRLDLTRALDDGKIILINTAKSYLRQTAASLFGRFFIAQVMQSVTKRQNQRRRTYLYLDEFQDYAEDSHVLFTLFEQARKYELGLIVAHQYLGQLPTQLQQSIAANTAIKFAASVSAEDDRKLANQMQSDPGVINELPRGTFAVWLRNIGRKRFKVDFGKLAKTPEISSLSDIRDSMRVRYGVRETTSPTPETPGWGQEGPDSPMD